MRLFLWVSVCVCARAWVCLCILERETFFSVCKFLPDRGNARFRVLKPVATSRRECGIGKKKKTEENRGRQERRRAAVTTLMSTNGNKKWMIFFYFLNVTSMRKFSGIFLTMHLASCYSFRHLLRSCFVLCCFDTYAYVYVCMYMYTYTYVYV